MFLYTVHNRRSELWPFGPAGSGVALLPILPEDGVCAAGFYSHALSIERQRQKFVALEAMHDVRDLQWPGELNIGRLALVSLAELRALAHGMGVVAHKLLAACSAAGRIIFCDIVRRRHGACSPGDAAEHRAMRLSQSCSLLLASESMKGHTYSRPGA